MIISLNSGVQWQQSAVDVKPSAVQWQQSAVDVVPSAVQWQQSAVDVVPSVCRTGIRVGKHVKPSAVHSGRVQ